MLDLIGPLVFGIVGSVHCLGMCGPLVVAYSLHLKSQEGARPASVLPAGAMHHAAFHAGRLLTYGFLGGVAGAVTGSVDLHRFFGGFRQAATLSGGLLMVVFGVGLLSVFPIRLPGPPAWPASSLARFVPRLLSSKSPAARVALGAATGFLPCMLSFAMIVKAAATADPFFGFLTMLSFGVGTVPVLFFAGLSASLLSSRARLLGERVAAGTVIVMGLLLVVKSGIVGRLLAG